MDFSTYRARSATPSLSSASTSSSSGLSHQGSAIFSPLSFDEEDQDPPWVNTERLGWKDMDDDYDHVKWQGSQTACQALNQLIDSSKDDVKSLKARNTWQREASYDQIPGFSLLSTADKSSTSAYDSPVFASRPRHPHRASTSDSTSTRPSSRPPSRSRVSDTKSRPRSSSNAPSKDVTNLPLPPRTPLPYFDANNPEKFLDIVKGVAKRLDENAGLRPRATKSVSSSNILTGSSSSIRTAMTAQKRPRVQSHGSTSENMKDAKRQKSHAEIPKDGKKDKGKMKEEDVRTADLEVDMDDQPKTSSQLRMPPPVLPAIPLQRDVKQEALPAPASSSSSLHHHGHYNVNPTPTPESVRTPRLHPLLVQQSQGKSSTVTSASASTVIPTSHHQPQAHPNPIPYSNSQASSSKPLHGQVRQERSAGTSYPGYPGNIRATPIPKPEPHPDPPPQSSRHTGSQNPKATLGLPTSSQQSSRPPPLGMRRTHTYPSSMQQKTGELPKKQKGFKPPLLTNSQPQASSQSSQMQMPTHVKVEKDTAGCVPKSKTEMASKSAADPGSAGGRSAIASSSIAYHATKPVSADSSRNYLHRPAENPAPAQHPRGATRTAAASSSNIRPPPPQVPVHVAPARAPSPGPLPEPADGDPDSSFGDIDLPFDIAALDEAMKKYD
ncbi:hypothetical protein CVT26_011010 [Gymnopilus dilepis]|uniref:Uncharacterized protein n=1 Tax=Gymnopilus dilepis TaxID=231916 RepID=A0A409VY69_9AGAR|nr:hypothetical protein CVT26_011010 [Gymnopilus dilepis]